MITRIVAALATSSFVVACVSCPATVAAKPPTAPPASASAQAHAPGDRHVYRLDFVIAATDPGKPAVSSTYSLNLEELDTGEVHMGTNVALSAQSRTDVGLKIKASLGPALGEDLILRTNIEMSALEESATIRKISLNGDAVLKNTLPTTVATLEDPVSHKHFQVTAAATKLR